MNNIWKIGDVTVTRIVEIERPFAYHPQYSILPDATPEAVADIPWLKPHFVDHKNRLIFSIHMLIIETPDHCLVVDTCIGNDKPRQMTGGEALQTDLLQRLQQAGVDRHAVDTVICTHLHVDHVGWNTMLQDGKWVPTFPNARYLFGKDEYDYWKASKDASQIAVMSDSVTPLFESGLVDLVATNHRISPHISLRPTLGHTPGHVSVAIESEGESALITGDFIHHPCQMARTHWCAQFDEDQTAARHTRENVLSELADTQVLVIGTHFATPTAGYVIRNGDGYQLITDKTARF